ncbi:MAG TPA: histidine kinase [Caulobacterales bacterium]|nr:histidine kinase [Caulobacterales bacterium]
MVRWGAHVLFWAAYFLFRTAAAHADPPSTKLPDFPYDLNRALAVGSYMAMTGILLALIAGPRTDKSGPWRNLGLIVGALALAPLTEWAEEFWPRLLMPHLNEPSQMTPLISYYFMFGWVLMLWGLVQALLAYHFEIVAQSRAVARAQSLAYDAQLRMLHYQINPHFLFNTLNAISTLVLDKRTELAEAMLMRLSGFLRYSLDRQPTELAALSAELEAQRKYLEIEQTRFGDKLRVRFDVEPGLERARLPSLILQPILENAIRYAITPSADGGEISVSARRDGGTLRIRVDDDGPGFAPEAPKRGRGVGLANARERLMLIYGDQAGLSAENLKPHGCRIELWLPIEEERVARTVAPSFS